MTLRRERSGAASLSGCDLPPAETLAAHAAVCARAQVYKDSGAFPGVLMDQFRAMAYLDLMNDISAEARIAAGPPKVGPGRARARARSGTSRSRTTRARPPRSAAAARTARATSATAGARPPEDDAGNGPDGDEPDDGGQPAPPTCPPPSQQPQSSPPQSSPPQSSPPPSSPWSAPPSSPAPPKPTDLTIPLAALLGRQDGPARATASARSTPRCAAPWPRSPPPAPTPPPASPSPTTTATPSATAASRTGRRRARLPGAPAPPLTALAVPPQPHHHRHPAREAAPASRTTTPARPRIADRLGPHPASHTPTSTADPPTSKHPPRRPALVPDLDHHPAQRPALRRPPRARPHPRTATTAASPHAYEPNDMLRHLVQIRDRECTLPTCSRHARETRLRARRALRPGRTNLRLQRRSPLPRLPPGQTSTRLESHPAQTRMAPMGNPVRPDLHPRTQAIPHLTRRRRPDAEAAAPRPGRRARIPAGGVPRSARARECPGPQRR